MESNSDSENLASSPRSSVSDKSLKRRSRFESIEPLRAIYRTASKAFLLNKHHQAWDAIQAGLEAIHNNPANQTQDQKPWWTQIRCSIDSTIDHELLELDRKFQILRITFLTSVLQVTHSPIHQHFRPDSFHEPHHAFDGILGLLQNEDPIRFILRLLISNQADLKPPPGTDDPQSTIIQLSAGLSHLHPSILTAIALATIKLAIPHIGKQLIEGWLASIDSTDLNLIHQLDRKPIEDPKNTHKPLSNDLRTSYQNLIQVYSIHILGSLHEWEFAVEFVNAQSRLAGGILPPEIVHEILEAIELKKTQQIQSIKNAIHRQQQRQQRQQQQKINQHQESLKSLSAGRRRTEDGQRRRSDFIHHDRRPNGQGNEEEEEETSRAAGGSQPPSPSDESVGSYRKKGLSADLATVRSVNGRRGAVEEEQLTGFSSLRSQLSRLITSAGGEPPRGRREMCVRRPSPAAASARPRLHFLRSLFLPPHPLARNLLAALLLLSLLLKTAASFRRILTLSRFRSNLLHYLRP